MNSLTGTSYLIVGAGKGVGTAVAERLAADGAFVGLVARSTELIEPLARRLGNAVAMQCDGLLPGALDDAVERLITDSGRIDGAIVVANAFMMRPLARLTIDDIERTARVKVGLTLHAAQALAARLENFNPLRLIVVSTAGAYRGSAETAPFNVAEWGVRGLMASIDAELGPHGLRSTLLAAMGSLREGQEASVPGYESLISVQDVADAAAWILTRPSSQRYPEFRIEQGR